MHLLATTPGTIADGSAAVDLAQTPGDIVVLSSADTEIALLAAAQKRRRVRRPGGTAACASRRYCGSATISRSTSTWRPSPRARLVIARLLGGSAYWPYGVERLVETCRERGIPLALLPGDDKPDAELAERSTVAARRSAGCGAISPRAAPPMPRIFCAMPASLIGHEAEWAEPAPLLRAGSLLARPRAARASTTSRAKWRGDGGIVPIVFYRALVQSGNTAPVDALVEALSARRLRPLPIFVQQPEGRRSRGIARRSCSPLRRRR